jgi:mono/diheme cytochrome c family protein
MRQLAGVLGAVLLAAGLWFVQAGEKPRPADEGRGDAALLEHGKYLALEVAGCTHCHTPQDAKGNHDPSRLLQGATLTIQPKVKTSNWADKSPDITHSGLAGVWSEAEMVKFLTTGLNPEGEKPTAPMPAFHLHEKDARAIALYLRSLPGKKGKADSKAK